MMKSWTVGKPLRDHCTLGIGGPAAFFTEVKTVEEMQETLRYCHENQIPFFILGKGSNTLFDDRGFKGLVILNKIEGMRSPAPGVFHAGAGYSFSLLGVQTARQQWGGLEFASGIPASVGGAVFMNAGANGTETCDCLTEVDFVDATGKMIQFKREELAFSYRHSPFQTMRGAIVGATFTLKPSETARTKQIEIVTNRKKSQPLAEKSAGCIFRNPGTQPAGALIDKAGLKGRSSGDAAVSDLHANFLINKGEATAADFLSLIDQVRQAVNEQTGIHLESEVRVIPYE